MNKDKRREILVRLRDNNPKPTTELEYSTPFELLAAVLLSAQATDVGVNKATRKLFPVANTPEAILALGEDGLNWLGPNFTGLSLFGPVEGDVASVALVRMNLRLPGAAAPRAALCAFGSGEDDGFTPAMGCELVAFVARVVERMAERWPLEA